MSDLLHSEQERVSALTPEQRIERDTAECLRERDEWLRSKCVDLAIRACAGFGDPDRVLETAARIEAFVKTGVTTSTPTEGGGA